MSCGVGCRSDSDSAWLWLWHRPAATAPTRPLAWKLPYVTGVALKSKRKKERERKEEKRREKRKEKEEKYYWLQASKHPELCIISQPASVPAARKHQQFFN